MIRQSPCCFYFFLACSLLISGGCNEKSGRPFLEKIEIASPSPDSGQTLDIRHARGFQLKLYPDFEILQVLNPLQSQTDTLRYLLLQRQQPIPAGYDSYQVVRIPVSRVIITSTTHLGMMSALGVSSKITGVADPNYVYDRDIRKKIDRGVVASLSGGNMNMEQVIALDPDLLIISGGQASRFDEYQLLMDSGIGVVVNSEWLENTPLARAEWIKMMGLLFGRKEKAEQRFNKIEKEYSRLETMTKNVEDKPLVINNLPYKGAWFVSGGNSYVATFLRDAGASYPWFNTSSFGSLKLDFESVFEQGLNADVWLTPGTATTKEEILQKDQRLKAFDAFKEGRIYNNTRRSRGEGANDYWESGVVNPHLILADLVKILHPDLLPEYQLYYYEKVR